MICLIICTLLTLTLFVPMIGTSEAPAQESHQSITRGWITLPEPTPVDMILEESICRRMSFHSGFPGTPLTDAELSTILWAAYGMTHTGGRTIYSPNGTYSITIYVIRSDATYIYVPANHSLFLWKTGNYLYLGQSTGAPVKLGLVWNQSIAADEKAAMAEVGMIAQNVYFDANALNLAALTTGMSVNDLYELDLPSNEKPEIIMHVGHPPSAYDFYYSPLPQSNLPRVVNNTLTLAEAVNTRQIAYSWNTTELSLLEQSQILWASYGTSYLYDDINNKRHRTPPSAVNVYPFKVYMANQTGVYQYAPTTHSISLIVTGDKRELVQDAIDPGNISVAAASMIIIPFRDNTLGSQYSIQWWWYESGAIIHNILLEATALNLGANVVSVITDQNALRAALGLSSQTNLVCFHVGMAGHTNGGTQNNPPSNPIVSGPSSGKRNVQYNYTIVSIDPDNDEVSYFADWDDGSNSGWVGPYPSDQMITLSHAWSQPGSYSVKVKAKDTHSLESNWSTIDMMIGGPVLEITIKGGVGINAVIRNNGTAQATNITWAVSCDGGLIIPRQMTGTKDSIEIGSTFTLRPLIFGLGKSTITVTVNADEGVTVKGVVNGFFLMLIVIGVK
jgi:SagB-type dehydrogenase family enzyme